jgi:DinB family protein
MPPQTPYSHDLGAREPVRAMRETIDRIHALTSGWSGERFERSYAPGKWSARLILTHLAQSELAFGNRVRMALSVPNYIAQPFDQDAWIARESRTGGIEAASALIALSRMNVVLFESLSPADRQTTLAHPEYGSLTVEWIIHQIAGHQIHHLAQLEKIASLQRG